MDTEELGGPHVVAVEDNVSVLQRILGALESSPAVVGEPHQYLEEVIDGLMAATRPNVLVLGPSQANHRGLERVGDLIRSNPRAGAVLVVAEPDTALLRAALRAGVGDAVPLERIGDDLSGAVDEVWRHINRGPDVGQDHSRVAGADPAPGARAGRVVSVFSAKGGVGKSTVAVNLATVLAESVDQRVVLVDADLQFGDVGVMLRLRPEHNLLEAIAAGDQLDPVLLESLLLRDQRSGLYILPAPADPTSGGKITPQQISNLVGHFREMGAIAVVDVPSILDDIVLQVLAESDDIVFLVGTDVPAVKNARLGLQAVELVQIPLGRVLVVLNRADSKVQLPSRDIEKILEMRVDFSLPSDDAVVRSVNEGVPVVLGHGKSRFASRIKAMAELLLARSSADARK